MPACSTNWPCSPNGYKLLSPIGEGSLGTVWKAKVKEGKNEGSFVAIKKINLEKCADNKIEDIRKSMLLLNLLQNPNILSSRATFIYKQDLWLVFEIMEAGSMDKIIQAKYPNGIKDQTLIATILKETLQGIKYLHQNNQIHRDIKAGNILIGADGSVKISDFGVATQLKGRKKRNTFIGSPCWMAPEVLEETNGYDSKADIWSLGITALELAEGRPPNADLCTMKLLLKTLNEEPPKLCDESYWDENFHELVAACLVKDPAERLSAEDLLREFKVFFAKAKGKDYIKEKLLKGIDILQLQDENDTEAVSMNLPKIDTGRKCRGGLQFNFRVCEEEETSEQPNGVSFCLSDEVRRHKSEKCYLSPFDRSPTVSESKKEICSKLLHMQKTNQPVVSSGDIDNEFYFLNEEEN